MAKLPLYELLINEDEETGVDFIALVDSPAIEYDWVAFKSEFETYSDYPKAASENAKRALELRDKYNLDCGTQVGWTRANQLANGENISRETIARMSGFERHRENSKGNPKEDCGALMWLAWGGDEGIEWASRKLQQIDLAAEKISIDYDDTLSTARGQELASRLLSQGVDLYVISARNDKEKMLELTNKLGIDSSKVFATGSNKAKVEKINELGISKHYDNNAEVVKELGKIGEQFIVEPKSGESQDEFVSRCIAVEVNGGMDQEQAAAVCYAKWKKKGFSFKTTDKQIISGPAMIPDQPIYRRSKDGEEYNVVFTKSTIQKIVERYFKNQYNNNFNLQHKKNMLAEGVYLIESFIIDSMRGIKAPEGFEDLPDGSWFISCKVDNEAIWNDYIKSGKFKGFSVEGLFTDRKVEMVNNVQEAIALVDKLKLNKQNIYTNMSDVKVLLSKLKEIFSEESTMSFEEAKLADGLTIIKWEGPLAEGTSVMVISESGEVPAPDGEHELQDGRKITIENGKVTALVLPEAPAEMPEAPVEVEVEAKQEMAEDLKPMVEECMTKIMKMEEMIAALEAKISEKMETAEQKMGSQKEAFSQLVEIVEKLADAPSEVIETKAINVNFKAEKDNQYNKLNEILNILNK
jgi:hypothetical protein